MNFFFCVFDGATSTKQRSIAACQSERWCRYFFNNFILLQIVLTWLLPGGSGMDLGGTGGRGWAGMVGCFFGGNGGAFSADAKVDCSATGTTGADSVEDTAL